MDRPRFTRGNRDEPAESLGGFLTRSDRARPAPKEEEAKRPTFTRGPKKEEGADTGFARANFTSKRDEQPTRPAAKKEEGSSGPGLGFRNTNKSKKS